jgi:hypothetical protein
VLGEPGAALRCPCGHGVYAELSALGACNSTVAFFDDEPGSDTRSGRVRRCPGCNARLRLHALAPPRKP